MQYLSPVVDSCFDSRFGNGTVSSGASLLFFNFEISNLYYKRVNTYYKSVSTYSKKIKQISNIHMHRYDVSKSFKINKMHKSCNNYTPPKLCIVVNEVIII